MERKPASVAGERPPCFGVRLSVVDPACRSCEVCNACAKTFSESYASVRVLGRPSRSTSVPKQEPDTAAMDEFRRRGLDYYVWRDLYVDPVILSAVGLIFSWTKRGPYPYVGERAGRFFVGFKRLDSRGVVIDVSGSIPDAVARRAGARVFVDKRRRALWRLQLDPGNLVEERTRFLRLLHDGLMALAIRR